MTIWEYLHSNPKNHQTGTFCFRHPKKDESNLQRPCLLRCNLLVLGGAKTTLFTRPAFFFRELPRIPMSTSGRFNKPKRCEGWDRLEFRGREGGDRQRGLVIPLIFPNVPQSSLGILRVPHLPPLLEHPLKNPIIVSWNVFFLPFFEQKNESECPPWQHQIWWKNPPCGSPNRDSNHF